MRLSLWLIPVLLRCERAKEEKSERRETKKKERNDRRGPRRSRELEADRKSLSSLSLTKLVFTRLFLSFSFISHQVRLAGFLRTHFDLRERRLHVSSIGRSTFLEEKGARVGKGGRERSRKPSTGIAAIGRRRGRRRRRRRPFTGPAPVFHSAPLSPPLSRDASVSYSSLV